jgi:hypothetical protein
MKVVQVNRKTGANPMNNIPSMTEENINWYKKMIDAFNSLSPEEKQELADWEKNNLNGSDKATSDWPGWIKYIGLPPWKYRAN